MADSGFLDTFAALGEALGEAGEAVLRVPMQQIDEDPDNPRRGFDDAELEALAQTIAARGVLQPIVVRPADAQGRYRLRFGARRFRAAAKAGLQEIPAVIRGGELEPAEALVEQLIENDQREGLSTAELAQAVDRLLQFGLAQAEISRRLGRPKPQIAMLAAIKGMAPELRALAPRLGARTLYELHAAWKTDPGKTRRFLKTRRPETITQAEARELVGRTGTRQVRDPADGSVRTLDRAAPRSAPSRPSSPGARNEGPPPAPERATARFEVSAPGIQGLLVLDDVAAPSLTVTIRTPDGELHSRPAAKVKIVRVTPG